MLNFSIPFSDSITFIHIDIFYLKLEKELIRFAEGGVLRHLLGVRNINISQMFNVAIFAILRHLLLTFLDFTTFPRSRNVSKSISKQNL